MVKGIKGVRLTLDERNRLLRRQGEGGRELEDLRADMFCSGGEPSLIPEDGLNWKLDRREDVLAEDCRSTPGVAKDEDADHIGMASTGLALIPEKVGCTMSVLSRENRESVVVGRSIHLERLLKITALEIQGTTVRLGFKAGDEFPVRHWEVWERSRVRARADASCTD